MFEVQPIWVSTQKGPEEASNPPSAPIVQSGKWRPQVTRPGFQTWFVQLGVLFFLQDD